MENTEKNILYLVLPAYNEEECIGDTAKELKKKYESLIKAGRISKESKILFVNDGSSDRTAELIKELYEKDPVFALINLSGNCGHQNALIAGLMSAKEHADAVISIDADLQQDINAIDLMLDKYFDGCDIVYGVRNDRKSDGFFKKLTALGFYDFMHMCGCKIITNHADYRLLSKRALESLSEYNEVNLFLRGLIPIIGYRSDIVYFDVHERKAGSSKYTLRKMVRFAIDGITSFSIRPIRFITLIGGLMFIVSLFFIILTIWEYYHGKTLPGFASMYCAIWFIGSIQLISLGVVGEYIGKIYMETKKRPRYHIESYLWRE